MRCLVLSSLLLLLYSSTFAQKHVDTDTLKSPSPIFESVKYQASIDVIGKHLSGILVFKTQEDSSIRTVFVNEMGVTFFDITFFNDRYVYNSIMESMDKKAVKISLAKDLGMILIKGIFKKVTNIKSIYPAVDRMPVRMVLDLKRKGTVRYYMGEISTGFPLIENYGRKKKVISISQFYKKNNPMPDSIFVEHHNVNFTISLKQFDATE